MTEGIDFSWMFSLLLLLFCKNGRERKSFVNDNEHDSSSRGTNGDWNERRGHTIDGKRRRRTSIIYIYLYF